MKRMKQIMRQKGKMSKKNKERDKIENKQKNTE